MWWLGRGWEVSSNSGKPDIGCQKARDTDTFQLFCSCGKTEGGKKKIKKERTNSTTGKSRLWNADLAEISKKKKRRTALKSEGTELRGWPLNYVAGHSAPPWPAWGLLLLSLGWPRGLNTIGTVATTVQRPPMGTSITFHGL